MRGQKRHLPQQTDQQVSEGKRYLPGPAAQRLSELLGVEVPERRLTNWRYARRGPQAEYLGGRVTYSEQSLVRFAREAFKPQPAPRYRLRST